MQPHREREYLVFCDESDKRGKYYSNFYGGVLVGASQYQCITERLNALKSELGLHREIKWEKVTEQYLERYATMIDAFFGEVAAGHLRIRIMFTQNAYIPQGLSREQLAHEYYLLYYQFVKHAFGFRFIGPHAKGTRLRLYFDQFPDTGEKSERFKGYLLALRESKEFRTANILLTPEDITEVRSHDHVLAQCLDIVLGAMTFRLNDKHKEKPVGQRIRGKRTRAKEKLYKRINQHICTLRPRFNIGVSTRPSVFPEGNWSDPYLHWLFKPTYATYDATQTKRQPNTDDPTRPTNGSDA